MPEESKPLSFRLPKSETIEFFIIELPDGRTVARTSDELEALPERERGRILATITGPPPGAGI